MDDIWMRFIENMGDRVTGPMKFRLILQPVIAVIFAVISGLEDAKAHRKPYVWSLFFYPETRAEMLRDGWKRISKVFIVALLLDVIYQIIVLDFVYLGEAIIVAFTLAILPYLIIRVLVNRLARIM